MGPHEAEVTGRTDTTGGTSHSLTSSERMNTDEIMFQWCNRIKMFHIWQYETALTFIRHISGVQGSLKYYNNILKMFLHQKLCFHLLPIIFTGECLCHLKLLRGIHCSKCIECITGIRYRGKILLKRGVPPRWRITRGLDAGGWHRFSVGLEIQRDFWNKINCSASSLITINVSYVIFKMHSTNVITLF